MSDDRLYLRCKCGGEIKLASIYHGDEAAKVPDAKQIEAFLNSHLDLSRCGAWNWGAGPVGFSLASER